MIEILSSKCPFTICHSRSFFLLPSSLESLTRYDCPDGLGYGMGLMNFLTFQEYVGKKDGEYSRLEEMFE